MYNNKIRLALVIALVISWSTVLGYHFLQSKKPGDLFIAHAKAKTIESLDTPEKNRLCLLIINSTFEFGKFE